jgi:hypothetical protein
MALGFWSRSPFYGSLFYFGFAKRGGIYNKLRTQLAQNSLACTNVSSGVPQSQ